MKIRGVALVALLAAMLAGSAVAASLARDPAALVLRIYDPWAHQGGARPGGLPDDAFLQAPAPDTGSVVFATADGRARVARVVGWSSAATPGRRPAGRGRGPTWSPRTGTRGGFPWSTSPSRWPR